MDDMISFLQAIGDNPDDMIVSEATDQTNYRKTNLHADCGKCSYYSIAPE